MGNYCYCQNDQLTNKKQNITISIKSIKGSNNNKTQKLQSFQQPEGIQKGQNRVISKHGTQNYQSLKYLGRGTFGDVVLAQDKQTSQKYAMKIIDKTKIKQVNVMQCKMIKSISHKDILVSIRQTFQNQNKIYIIMEYLNKGDIYFYLKKKEVIFTEEVIRELSAQIIYGVEVLHNYGIVYRQLKPENILVTIEGHIKLTDYGLSKMLIQNKATTSTFVGALQYMAPEAIKGNYGKQVDLWAIGILLFQLRFQSNPFATLGQTELMIQNNIQKISIEDILNTIIGKISQQFRDLLIALLQKNPKDRITLEDVKLHPFYKNTKWTDVMQRKNHPPLKEFIQSNDHIRFRDPTNQAQIAHRTIKMAGKQDYKANLYQFRNSK